MRTQKISWWLFLFFLTACSAQRTVVAATATSTLQMLPSPTATIRPTPSQTPTQRPIEAEKIAQLGSRLKKHLVVSAPDGKTYTITDDAGVHLYDSQTKKESGFFPAEFGSAQYSPNSQMIVVLAWNFTKLIRVSDGKVLGEFKVGYMFMPYSFSPDNKRFAYLVDCSWFYEPECKETIHVWDIETQQEVFVITAQSVITIFEFRKITFDPTGAFLLATDSKDVIHVWDAASGKVAFYLQSPAGSVDDLVFSHNGKYLASIGDGRNYFNILLWDWASKERRTVTGKYNNALDSIRRMTFSADDSHIDLIIDDNSTMSWDLATGKLSQGEKFIDQEALQLQQMRERGEYIAYPDAVAYSPDGQTLAVGNHFLSPIVLWDLQTKKVRATLDGKAASLKYNHRGNRLIVRDTSGQNINEEDDNDDISIWDTEHNVKLNTFKIPLGGAFKISPDDSTLVVNSLHSIQFWDIEKGTLIQSWATPGLLESPSFLSYSADGKSINTVLLKALEQREYELSIRSWDASTGKQLPANLPPIHLGIEDGPVALQHDILAVFQYLPETTIILWDVKSGQKLQSIPFDAYHLPDVVFTQNDRVMIVNSSVFYDVQTGSKIYESNLGQEVLAFRPDGEQLATWDGDSSIYLWDISSILKAVSNTKP